MIKLVQLQAMRTQSHPYPVLRVKEIRSWARSEGYERIVRGSYVRTTGN
jgi:hypothetical protein